MFAADIDEFKVKRQEAFEFTQKPAVARDGDKVTITFTSKGYCDATVAIEAAPGRIIRHLASGVLGPNAPAPFRRDSLKQEVVWDGKDDQGNYVESREGVSVRVSLGLRARFERSLYWEPKKRASSLAPILCATPEGVYVYDGGAAVDHLRLFDHDGNYLRTIYPFPAGKVESVTGLAWHTFPQDGRRWPIKLNFLQNTMLSSGTNTFRLETFKRDADRYDSVVGSGNNEHFGMGGYAATAMAVRAGRVALAYVNLNRMATDGSSAVVGLYGPRASFTVRRGGPGWRGGGVDIQAGPGSAALSPDGQSLYLAGYSWPENWDTGGHRRRWLHGVARMKLDGDEPPTVFAGSMKQDDTGGGEKLDVPGCVRVDEAGLVYVTDFMNDRVQVFDPQGKRVRSIAVSRPASISIDPRRGELYVFSWLQSGKEMELHHRDERVPARLMRMAPLADPKVIASYPLPLEGYADKWGSWDRLGGTQFRAELDPWADSQRSPTIWLVPGLPGRDNRVGIRLLVVRDGKLVVRRDFAEDAARSVVRLTPPHVTRQRLYVNPATGKLYVGEGQQEDGTGAGQAFQQLVEIDPASGRTRLVNLPFDAEEMCFDAAGRAYLRERRYIGRFDPVTWREIPWDYGEEQPSVGFASGRTGKRGRLVSAMDPGDGINWHMGGMSVSPTGHLATTSYVGELTTRTDERKLDGAIGRAYQPRIYPGRVVGHYRAVVHVWDQHGRLLHEDAAPGLPDAYGLEIDRDDNVYVLSAATRVLDGQRYYNDMTGTLIKFRPGRGRIVSADPEAPVPLTEAARPKRPVELQGAMQGPAWAEGVEWVFGGVGYMGKNRGVGCSCYNTRFCLDYFARSFAPEIDRYSVAVLDANGNVILRIGRYGNADDGVPLVKEGGVNLAHLSDQAERRPLGGDEVALFHGAYVATHTDRRLFIADPGNARIVSVKLDYHATERVPLKEE